MAAGVYTGSFTTNASGTASAYVTYQGTTANFGATVNCAQIAADHGDVSTCPQLVGTDNTTTWANDGDYVAIEGFDVTGPGINGIYTQGNATYIGGNSVHDVLTSTCNSTGGSGINLAGTNDEVVGNYVHNIGPYPSACGYVQGIYFLAAGGYAENNLSFDNSGFGIQLWHYPSQIALVNNTIFSNASGGIVLGTDSAFTVDHITVANNIVVNNGGWGIQEQGPSASSTGLHNVYENNLVEGNAAGAIGLQNGLKAAATVTLPPQFVNYTGTAAGDYHLAAGSPAMGAGLASIAPAADFDGNPRPAGGPIDIGAYQGSGETAVVAAQVSLSATSLAFPATAVGKSSAAETVTLTNSGAAAVSFSGGFAVSGPFTVGGQSCEGSLAAKASCTFTVSFEPTASGAAKGTVTITDSAGQQTIELSGQGN